jgi:hypothetical protein
MAEASIHVKARAVARERGYSDGENRREYKDWHIDIRTGSNHVTVWNSSGMVFMSLAGVPVYYRPGPWEAYLDRLFHRQPTDDLASEPD